MAEAEAAGDDVFAVDVFEAEPVVETAVPVPAAPVLDEETARMFRPSWEPVDEQTFSFEEPAAPAVIAKGEDFAFGVDAELPELAVFADESPVTLAAEAPVVEVVQAAVMAPPLEDVALSPTPQPLPQPAAVQDVTLTEEQLRAALASVSKEVIERVVWEVVPDLAETMIVEAIRRIREGR
jgi:hypothetical protein